MERPNSGIRPSGDTERHQALPRLRIELPAVRALRDQALIDCVIDQVYDRLGAVVVELRVYGAEPPPEE